MTENEISSMVVDGATGVHPTLVGRGLFESAYEELRAQTCDRAFAAALR